MYIRMYTSPCLLCLQSLYSYDVLDNLTEDDVRVLMETEDEVSMFACCILFVYVCTYIQCLDLYLCSMFLSMESDESIMLTTFVYSGTSYSGQPKYGHNILLSLSTRTI